MKFLFLFITTSLLLLFCDNASSQKAFSGETLRNPNNYKSEIEGKLDITEIPVFHDENLEKTVLLENGYAKYTFKNADSWPPNQHDNVIPKSVRVIFTKYPKDSAFWLTDYKWLLAKRLNALFDLDSNLNSTQIDYSILLQTDCNNEFETMQLFHGIEITYELSQTIDTRGEDLLDSGKNVASKEQNLQVINRITYFMYLKKYSMDSTVFLALDRNTNWKNSLLVMDWTGSMYGPGAEAMLWHALNSEKSSIKHVAFFNDGDKLKDRKKVIGFTGGIYYQESDPLLQVTKLMKRLAHKGNGGDSPENDLEAICTAMIQAKNEEDIILIADNGSCVRDFVLQQCLNKPLHILLCNTRNGINPQYINLAWKTDGSLHTKDWDLENIDQLLRSNQLIIEDKQYVLTQNGWIMPANREDHYFAFCDTYYSFPKKKNPKKRRKEPDCYFKQ